MTNELKSHPDRLLVDHISGTAKRAIEKAKTINWQPFGLDTEKAIELVKLCAICHDFAKASKDFQDYINDPHKSKTITHAPLSSIVTFRVLQNNGFDVKLSTFGYFVVKNHHGNLVNFEPGDNKENIKRLEAQFQSIPKSFLKWFELQTKTCISSVEELSEDLEKKFSKFYFINSYFSWKDYVLIHTLLSILVSSDHEDAALKDLYVEIGQKLSMDLVEKYIKKIPKDNPLYNLRKEFHDEVNKSIKRINERILSLTAPTGIGKTLANIKIALARQNSKSVIVYALPFINIIDQTFEILEKILQISKIEHDATTILPYHHLSDPQYKVYEQPSIQRVLIENWHSQIVVTTFVSLFESLLTNRRVPFFYKLLSAVIILDEVQSIPHEYWEPISQIMATLTDFGATVILSTATQPMILKNTRSIVQKDYSKYVNRTRVFFHGDIDWETFLEIIQNYAFESIKEKQRLLIVLNTIRESKDVFRYLCEKLNFKNLYYLSSNVIPKHRKERIKALKELKDESAICVSTQVIEAGVDISFDKVVRDEAPLDSIIQVAGRCNRTSKNQMGEVHIYRVLDQQEGNRKRSFSSYIYDSVLLDSTRELSLRKRSFEEREFPKLVSEYFEKIKSRVNTDKSEILKSIEGLKFEEIGTNFRLIQKGFEEVTIFVEYDDFAVKLRENLNKTIKDQNMEKFQKLAKIKKLLHQMALYMIDVPMHKEKDLEGALTVENGFLIITKDILKYWYNETIGFERNELTMII